MGVMSSQITSVLIVHSTVCSGANQRKYQSSMPLAFVRGMYQWTVNSLHKGQETWKMFPLDDVIMVAHVARRHIHHCHCHYHHCHDRFKGHHNSNIYISHCYYLCQMARVMFSWILLCNYAISKAAVHIRCEVACVARQEIALWSVLYPEQPSLVSRKAISWGNRNGP